MEVALYLSESNVPAHMDHDLLIAAESQLQGLWRQTRLLTPPPGPEAKVSSRGLSIVKTFQFMKELATWNASIVTYRLRALQSADALGYDTSMPLLALWAPIALTGEARVSKKALGSLMSRLSRSQLVWGEVGGRRQPLFFVILGMHRREIWNDLIGKHEKVWENAERVFANLPLTHLDIEEGTWAQRASRGEVGFETSDLEQIELGEVTYSSALFTWAKQQELFLESQTNSPTLLRAPENPEFLQVLANPPPPKSWVPWLFIILTSVVLLLGIGLVFWQTRDGKVMRHLAPVIAPEAGPRSFPLPALEQAQRLFERS